MVPRGRWKDWISARAFSYIWSLFSSRYNSDRFDLLFLAIDEHKTSLTLGEDFYSDYYRWLSDSVVSKTRHEKTDPALTSWLLRTLCPRMVHSCCFPVSAGNICFVCSTQACTVFFLCASNSFILTGNLLAKMIFLRHCNSSPVINIKPEM